MSRLFGRESYMIDPEASHHGDALQHIQRQQRDIHRQLQGLINAQSSALLAPDPSDPDSPSPNLESTEERTLTPASSIASSSIPLAPIPGARRGRAKTTLEIARDGIVRHIDKLLELEEDERRILRQHLFSTERALDDIDEFNQKKDGLEKAISDIHNEEESQRSKRLQEKAQTLGTDIQELETRLCEMKVKHKQMVDEISSINNSIDAKLSSYTESLSLLQADMREFLAHPPSEPLKGFENKIPFYSLQPKRRTLPMAEEYFSNEWTGLERKTRNIEKEIMALQQGGSAWSEVVTEVTGFEKRLRTSMRRYMRIDMHAELDEAEKTKYRNELIDNILGDLAKTTHFVDRVMNLAEKKGWNLIICCVGAELTALRQARSKLRKAFDLPLGGNAPVESSEQERGSPSVLDETPDPLGVDNPGAPDDLLKDRDPHRTESRSEDDEADPPADLLKDEEPLHTESRSEDDEPDPSWLLSES
ncbi:hypothetical protein N7474_008341 [Penicillium riverlandense]|uniref:uncharacterized protein n=1 Tax=Penicillium riverlandense TaxID=1903569 RepID=UPI00254893FF|nr:uncharacterized protein N7474_008341 [Penicillium riverlandense]KAJ5812040.1 hypothetical protein N7474_008341 [Penicillium riverlandense]